VRNYFVKKKILVRSGNTITEGLSIILPNNVPGQSTYCGMPYEMEISISCLLASSQRTCMTYTWSCMYSLGLLMMDEGTSKTCRAIFSKLEKLCI